MTIDFTKGDDLSDMLGGSAPAAPKALPTDETFARIRASVPEFVERCPKCAGTGQFRSYSGRVLGPCFACKGKGSKTFKSSKETRMQNREKAAERKVAQADRNWEAFVEAHPAEAEFLKAELAKGYGVAGERWAEMMASFMEAIRKWGDLSQGRLGVLTSAIARRAEKAAQKAQVTSVVQQQVERVDVANLVDCFQRAQEAGLKRFTLRFADAHFQVDRSNPDLIWVSQGGYGTARYGRITGGVFKPGRDATAQVVARIAEISKDPMAAAMAYAQVTSSCSVCGRHLENQDSVDAGIGPVCAGRLNRPGIKMVPVAPGDF